MPTLSDHQSLFLKFVIFKIATFSVFMFVHFCFVSYSCPFLITFLVLSHVIFEAKPYFSQWSLTLTALGIWSTYCGLIMAFRSSSKILVKKFWSSDPLKYVNISVQSGGSYKYTRLFSTLEYTEVINKTDKK